MSDKVRVDVAMVQRGLAPSREQAQRDHGWAGVPQGSQDSESV